MRTRTMMIAWMGVALVVAAALAWATGPAAVVAAAPAAELTAPLIASAQVSGDQATLTVSGLNLVAGSAGAVAPPAVSLALTPLPVTASSATSVTATLPFPLGAGTYLLVLSRSDRRAATFYVTIGAVGPRGPAGPAAVGPTASVWQ